MTHRMELLKVALIVLVLCSCYALPALGQTKAIVDVNVITMNSEEILRNQTVLIEGDRITMIAPTAAITFSNDAEIIEGNGGYLIPGLADMHTHLGHFDRDPRHLLLYLSEGTTTVRSLTGSELELSWRDRIDAGELLGPSIIVGRTMYGKYRDSLGINSQIRLFRMGIFAIPLAAVGLGMLLGLIPKELLIGLGALSISVLSWVVPYPSVSPTLSALFDRPDVFISESPFHATHEVERMHNAGFDFVKLYDGLTLNEFEVAAKKAHDIGLYVAGHLPNQIPIETAFKAGQQEIVHMDELLSFHWKEYNPTGENDPELMRTGFPVDATTLPETVSVLSKYDIPIVANLSTDEMMVRLIFDTPGVLAGEEYDVIRPEKIESWLTSGRNVTSFADQGPNRRDVGQPFLEELTNALHDAGVLITIGTDTNVEGCIPSNIHRELELLVKSGFTPYEALEAGTRVASDVSERMGLGDDFGTIEVGKRADFVLLTANPLENISSTRERMGVMIQGNWYTQSELNAMVADFVATY